MTKVFCDICGAEQNNNLKMQKRRMATCYAASAWQGREMDVCENCLYKLDGFYGLLESEFVKRKGKIKLKIDDE